MVDLGKESRIRAAVEELRGLLDSGEVDRDRTRAMLAGNLEAAPMGDDDSPTTIRAPRALLDRAEALISRWPPAAGGIGRVSRSTVLRHALERGIAALEAEAADLPTANGDDIRADLSELRARLDRIEGPYLTRKALDAGRRLLLELADDGVSIGAIEDCEAVAFDYQERAGAEVPPALAELVSVLALVAAEARSEDGLGEELAGRLRRAVRALAARRG